MGNGGHLARLLLIDNDREYADSVRDRLLREGWRAEAAYSAEEAKQRVRENRYQLCILDKRLQDEHREDDRSGIELIPELWRLDGLLYFFLLTQFDDYSEASQQLTTPFPTGKQRCKAYLPKSAGVDRLLDDLGRVEKEALGINHALSLPEDLLVEALEPLLREDRSGGELRRQLVEEADLLLRTVFMPEYRYRSLEFELLDAQGRSGARMIAVSNAGAASWVLKLASRLAVEEEWDNYVDLVQPLIQQRPDIAPDMCQVCSRLGVIVYSRVQEIRPGSRLRNVLEYFLDPEVTVPAIERSMGNIPNSARKWFEHGRRLAPWDLTAFYSAHFHFEQGELLERFQRLNLGIADLPSTFSIEGERVGGKVMNPLPFLARTRFLVESQWNTCHGDLTVSNVLVPEGVPWFIDFASTGPGPAALDWVTLESSLKFEYPWQATPEAWLQLEEALTLQESLETPPSPPAGLAPEMGRLFHAVTSLRSELGRFQHLRGGMFEYLVGLFYATLSNIRSFWLKKYKPHSRNDKAYRVLTTAGLIAERLAGLGVNRTDLELVYSWRETTELPDDRGDGKSVSGQMLALEAAQIARERLLYSTLNHLLGRHPMAAKPEEEAFLGKSLDQLRELKSEVWRLTGYESPR